MSLYEKDTTPCLGYSNSQVWEMAVFLNENLEFCNRVLYLHLRKFSENSHFLHWFWLRPNDPGLSMELRELFDHRDISSELLSAHPSKQFPIKCQIQQVIRSQIIFVCHYRLRDEQPAGIFMPFPMWTEFDKYFKLVCVVGLIPQYGGTTKLVSKY